MVDVLMWLWLSLVGGYEEAMFSALVYIISLAAFGAAIWYFFDRMAERELFPVHRRRWARFVAYLVLYPAVSFLWFVMQVFFIVFTGYGVPLNTALALGAAVVGAVRISAYIKEDYARDLATLVPVCLLAVLLTEPIEITPHIISQRFVELALSLPIMFRFLLLLTVLEWSLKLLEMTGVHLGRRTVHRHPTSKPAFGPSG